MDYFRQSADRLSKAQVAFLLVSTALPVCLYFSVLINDMRRLASDSSARTCPPLTLPCNETAVKSQCVDRKRWCDHVRDCDENEDEDLFNCYGEYLFVKIFLAECDSHKRPKLLCSQHGLSTTACECKLWMIDCSRKNLTQLPDADQFETEASTLELHHNNLVDVSFAAFHQFAQLRKLNMSFNQLTAIKSGMFSALIGLNNLALSWNNISEIQPGAFHGLSNLAILYLDHNHLSYFRRGAFDGIASLCLVSLKFNELSASGDWNVLPHSSIVELQNNRITTFRKEHIGQINDTKVLVLANNYINSIEEGALEVAASKFTYLDLSNNLLEQLPATTDSTLSTLRFLSVANNPVTFLHESTFTGLHSLQILNLSHVQMTNMPRIRSLFQPLSKLSTLEVPSFAICRYAPTVRLCYPHSDGISTVDNLLASVVLRVAIWIVAMVTCCGNFFVLVCRMFFRDEKSVHSLFIRNLAAADFIMGIYLMSVATHDLMYRDQYNQYALTWMDSWTCQLTGFLALLSYEMSMFLLAAMSIECSVSVTHPYNEPFLSLPRAFVLLATLWTVGIAVAGLPVTFDRHFYGTNGVCMPLHIHDPYRPGWQYTAVVFLGVNSVAVVAITVSYVAIAISVSRTRRDSCCDSGSVGRDRGCSVEMTSVRSGSEAATDRTGKPTAAADSFVNRSTAEQDRSMASRFFAIVSSNLVCWIPVALIKVLALADIRLSDEFYGWLTVFVLPVNSALNPLIYTFLTPSFGRKFRENFACRLKIVNSFPFIFIVCSRRRNSSKTGCSLGVTDKSTLTTRNGSVEAPDAQLSAPSMTSYDSENCRHSVQLHRCLLLESKIACLRRSGSLKQDPSRGLSGQLRPVVCSRPSVEETLVERSENFPACESEGRRSISGNDVET